MFKKNYDIKISSNNNNKTEERSGSIYKKKTLGVLPFLLIKSHVPGKLFILKNLY